MKAQFELHKHVRDEAATHFDSALRVIPVADEMLQRHFQAQLMERWLVLEKGLDAMQSLATRSLSTSTGSLDEKLCSLERELTELATLLTDMHGVIKTEEELQLYIERLQVNNCIGPLLCLYVYHSYFTSLFVLVEFPFK